MAWLIKSDGSISNVEPKNSTNFSLEELQEFVGGNIEICDTVDADVIMVINEEGKLKNLPLNNIATAAYKFGLQDCIVGDVLCCKYHQVR